MSQLTYRNYDLDMHVSYYPSHPMVMAVTFTDAEDGMPFGAASVNLGNDIGNGSYMQYGSTFIDENNMPGIAQAMQEAGLCEPYTRFGEPVMGQSGWCEYPLMTFDMDKLYEIDPLGVDMYKDAWTKGLAHEQRLAQAQYMAPDEASSEFDFSDDIPF